MVWAGPEGGRRGGDTRPLSQEAGTGMKAHGCEGPGVLGGRGGGGEEHLRGEPWGDRCFRESQMWKWPGMGEGQLSLGAGQLEVEAGASLEWRERLDPPPPQPPRHDPGE